MAIQDYTAVPPPADQINVTPAALDAAEAAAPDADVADAPARPAPSTPVKNGALDIEAWTISALQSLRVSPIARGTGSPLAIPLDQAVAAAAAKPSPGSGARNVVSFNAAGEETATSPPRRPPSRRDSQRRRELVLKGKEGSRQRRRWENAHLIGVPNAQPPQPADWEVHATHPIHRVPYQLAQFWDRGVRQVVEDKALQLQAARKKQQRTRGSATGLGVGEVPRDLREAAKRSPVVRSWVRSLEEPVRQYLHGQQVQRQKEEEEEQKKNNEGETGAPGAAEADEDSAAEAMDSEDEEIVFVGRNGAMRELQEKRSRWKPARRQLEHELVETGMVFDSFATDENAAYKRWLTHSICDYYGLESHSVTLPNPSRRVVYVGLVKTQYSGSTAVRKLPRPLWEAC